MPKERRALLLPPSAAHLPPPSSPAAAAAAKNAAADDGHFTHLPAEKGLDERSGVFLFTLCMCALYNRFNRLFFSFLLYNAGHLEGEKCKFAGTLVQHRQCLCCGLLLPLQVWKSATLLFTGDFTREQHYSTLAIVLTRLNVLMLSDAALDLVVAGCCCILIFSRK